MASKIYTGRTNSFKITLAWSVHGRSDGMYNTARQFEGPSPIIRGVPATAK